jgi:hypothetical protein
MVVPFALDRRSALKESQTDLNAATVSASHQVVSTTWQSIIVSSKLKVRGAPPG